MTFRNIYPICVALNEKNAERTIAVGRKFPFVEVRLDLGQFSEVSVKQTFKSLKNSIVTCRPGPYDDVTRHKFFAAAINSGAKFIDIEIETKPALKKSLISLAKKKKVRTIISYHNFKATPTKRSLESIINKAKRSRAEVIKIATLVRNQRDAKILLGLLASHDNLVVIGMGKAGLPIRIAAPMLGGLFTFASSEAGKETAAGQIDFESLHDMYLSLGRV